MKLLGRIIFIFFIFIVTLSVNTISDNKEICSGMPVDTISAVPFNDYDLLNSKDNNIFLQNIQRNDGLFVNNRKTDNSTGFGLNKIINIQTKSFINISFYEIKQLFSEYKSKINIISLLSEVIPNAP